MITNYYKQANHHIKPCGLADSPQWIHLTNPRESEINQIIETFNIPRDYLSNVLDSDEIARSENIFSDNTCTKLVVFLCPVLIDIDTNTYSTLPFSIVLCENIIITASDFIPDFFQELLNSSFLTSLTNQNKFILEVAWLIAHTYIIYLKKLSRDIKSLENISDISTKNYQLYALMNLKKNLVYLDAAIKSNHPVYNDIEEYIHFNSDNDTLSLLRNTTLENLQSEHMILKYQQLLENIGDLFSDIISNRLNNLMKFLTSISVILTIPSIIGALWGMNVALPFENYRFAFWIINGLVILLSFIFSFFLRKKNYL